ncbi:uncharacterized protein LOC123307874 [Coccinella septempunctata]|uniref:uncharacterized protein LOC123307874 n=1 Tax=Coccinella septempunctata TaxID=41139 RepID=UPI001D08E1D2|nr:uncharacterized protein LOC123307874 [Coccinella septempunctata]
MDCSGKRSRNFTEREKLLLVQIAKNFLDIIENKKIDSATVAAKKEAWLSITQTFNANSDTGHRTDKQLHALFDSLKKKARKNIYDCEMNKSGGATFTLSATEVEEKIMEILKPQIQLLKYQHDSTLAYPEKGSEVIQTGTTVQVQPSIDLIEDTHVISNLENQPSTSSEVTPEPSEISSEERKSCRMTRAGKRRKTINLIWASIVRRRSLKQKNEDSLAQKKMELLQLQIDREQLMLAKEQVTLDKTREMLEADLQLKLLMIEHSKLELEIKKQKLLRGAI